MTSALDLDLDTVARELHLPPDVAQWLAGLRTPETPEPDLEPEPQPGSQPGPQPQPPFALPSDSVADRRLEQLRVDPRDRADMLAARPSPSRHPAHWWMLTRIYHDQLARMGDRVPISGFAGWPALPARNDPVAMHLYAWALLAVLPAVRDHHIERGIPDDIAWDSIDLGESMRAHRAVHGVSGLGRFGPWSPPLRMRGAHYRLGRLEFNRGAISLGNGTCGFAIAVHIPGDGPLDAGECDRSLAAARDFFVRHYPDEPPAFFTCASWLLDPQLAEYLPASSNIVRFQTRFTILPSMPDHGEVEDAVLLDYVFGRPRTEVPVPTDVLDELPQESTLQRAYVSHLRSGRHWYGRTGWFPFS